MATLKNAFVFTTAVFLSIFANIKQQRPCVPTSLQPTRYVFPLQEIENVFAVPVRHGRRFGGIVGRHRVRRVGRRARPARRSARRRARPGPKVRAPRTGADAQRLPVRQVLPVRTATGVQHQTPADRRGRVAQAKLDFLAAQYIHRGADRVLFERQPD